MSNVKLSEKQREVLESMRAGARMNGAWVLSGHDNPIRPNTFWSLLEQRLISKIGGGEIPIQYVLTDAGREIINDGTRQG